MCTQSQQSFDDEISIEAPLDMVLRYGPVDNRQIKNLAVTMRTPGADEDLVRGFLFTEGIIQLPDEILSITSTISTNEEALNLNRVIIDLHPHTGFDPAVLERHFFAASSCGICGKTSMDLIQHEFHFVPKSDQPQYSVRQITGWKAILDQIPGAFARTGSMHTAVLFDKKGKMLAFAEDVGRHNALDKLLGYFFQKDLFPLDNHALLLSGRISFELIQKSLRAGIGVVAAIGAPSTAALELAEANGQTVVGFIKKDSFNVYCGEERIRI